MTASDLGSPQVGMTQNFISNYAYFGNAFDATVATLDPAYQAEAGFYEAFGGQGIQAGNSGQTLSFSQRAYSGFEGVSGTVGTAGVAFGGVGLTRLAGWTEKRGQVHLTDGFLGV